MIEVEQLVRDALGRHEADVPLPDPFDARPVARRARRRQVLNAAGAALVALAIVLGAIGGFGTLLRADRDRPGIDPPTPPPGAFAPVDLPPAGAGPSAPPDAEIAVSFYAEDVRPVAPSEPDEVERIVVDVYEDGRVIWSRCVFESWTDGPRQRPNQDACVPAPLPGTSEMASTGWVQQRLTPEAVDLLRTELLSTGLFERDFESVTTTNTPDLVEYLFAEVRDGERSLNVRADYQTLDFNPPRPSVEAGLERIQEILIDLDAWFPRSAWAEQEITAFIPSSYSFWFKRATVPQLLRDAVAVEVVRQLEPGELPPPADVLLSREGCEVVTLDEARAIVAGLEDAGITLSAEMSTMDILAYLVVASDTGAALYLEPNIPGSSSIDAELPDSC